MSIVVLYLHEFAYNPKTETDTNHSQVTEICIFFVTVMDKNAKVMVRTVNSHVWYFKFFLPAGRSRFSFLYRRVYGKFYGSSEKYVLFIERGLLTRQENSLKFQF